MAAIGRPSAAKFTWAPSSLHDHLENSCGEGCNALDRPRWHACPSEMGQELFWWVLEAVQPCMALHTLGAPQRLGFDLKLTAHRTQRAAQDNHNS